MEKLMRQLKLTSYFGSPDPVVVAEFIMVMLATVSFVGIIFTYLMFSSIPVWNWITFAFFILVKGWCEFFETCDDRRVNNLDDDRLPYMCRRQAD